MKTRDKVLIGFSVIWLLCLICFFVFYGFNNPFDEFVLKHIRENVRFISFHKLVTFFGNTQTYFYIFIPVGIWMYINKKGRSFNYILMAILISTAIMIIMKNLIQRPRPFEYFIIDQGGYSFPSGHSLVSSATYWTIYGIQGFKNRFFKYFLAVFPLLIGFSRLALGVHWPTDVLTGLLLGYCISSVLVYKFKKEV